MDYCVRISDETLGSMALAAIEAYCFGNGKSSHIETFGYIWGHTKRSDALITYYVSKLSVSISAIKGRNFVQPHRGAAQLKEEFVNRWSPQLTMLGHFHTHPYRNLAEVNQSRGYEFSDMDFQSFKGDDFLWNVSGDTPLMLAMTICQLQAVHDRWYEQLRDNLFEFSVGEFRFWLNASVGFKSGNERNHTNNTHSPVYLDLGSRYFNLSGDHIR